VRAEMDEDQLARVRLRTQLTLPVYRQREQTLKSVSTYQKAKRCGAHKQRWACTVARPPWEPQQALLLDHSMPRAAAHRGACRHDRRGALGPFDDSHYVRVQKKDGAGVGRRYQRRLVRALSRKSYLIRSFFRPPKRN